MTTRTLPLLFASLLLCLTNCHPPPSSADVAPRQVFRIAVDTTASLPVSDLVENFKLIPIRMPPGHLIGKIARICVAPDHRLFILDMTGPDIVVLDSTGKYLYTINWRGIGPGHFDAVSDFQIDARSNTFGIIDPHQAKFMRFDLSGNLKDEYPLEGTPGILNFSFLANGDIAFSRGIPPDRNKLQYSIVVMSDRLKVRRRLLHYDKSSSIVLNASYPFQSVGGETYYLPIYHNEIDRLDSAGAMPEYRLDFGDKWISSSFAYQDSHTDDYHWVRDELPHSGFVYFVNYALTTTHLLVYYNYQGNAYLDLIDRHTGQGRQTRLGKDFSLLGFTADNNNVLDDSEYVAYISDCSKLNQLTDKKYGAIFHTLAADTTQQNPVLLFTTFKRIP